MKRIDWLLILGVIAGAFVGAISVSYYAIQRFHLYRLRVPSGGRSYNMGEIDLWAVVGIIVGAFFGALGVSILRAINRRSN